MKDNIVVHYQIKLNIFKPIVFIIRVKLQKVKLHIIENIEEKLRKHDLELFLLI